jgi:hypothetical protein
MSLEARFSQSSTFDGLHSFLDNGHAVNLDLVTLISLSPVIYVWLTFPKTSVAQLSSCLIVWKRANSMDGRVYPPNSAHRRESRQGFSERVPPRASAV